MQSEDAKSRRNLGGEVSALTAGEQSLRDAPWYPARSGDVLTVRYAASGSEPACEQTYDVVEDNDGPLVLSLRSHTFPEEFAGSAGAYARGCLVDDPFFEPWMEVGPHWLAIERDGNGIVVHGSR
ncbi:hypothetical protein ACFTY8_44590 [Streptomyces mirabilis]|uniref:hypothetical protein n=1 Tax=Streptomyces mirabilis TaxID=68239 RepID=UPI00364564CA